MSDDELQPEPDDEESPTLFDQPDGVDWFLAHLVNLAEAYTIEQGVTLNVGGTLVSGVLISGHSYFEELRDTMKVNTKGSESEEFLFSIADSYGDFAKLYEKPDSEEDDPFRRQTYIHLRGAVVYGSNGPMSGQKGLLWRGKLRSVDGYIIGQMSQS